LTGAYHGAKEVADERGVRAIFGVLEAETGPLSERMRLLVAVLEMVPLSRQLPCARGWLGRPAKDREALASAFAAKSVYGLETTRRLLERCARTGSCVVLCGWTSARQMPHFLFLLFQFLILQAALFLFL